MTWWRKQSGDLPHPLRESAQVIEESRTAPLSAPGQKYGGLVVHYSRDDHGPVEVVDVGRIRSLHFGTSPKQSAMDLEDPDRLELSYVRSMLAGLLLLPLPRRVLILGLGGGSLAKFLYTYFPDCRIDAVELRPRVAEVAIRYFGLPDSERLRVHFADCAEHLSRVAGPQTGAFDCVFVDVYDEHGLAAGINDDPVFAACAALLQPEGVIAMNLWGNDTASFRRSWQLLQQFFGGRCCRLPVPGRGNIIGLAWGEGLAVPQPDNLRRRALDLEAALRVEFPRFLDVLGGKLRR